MKNPCRRSTLAAAFMLCAGTISLTHPSRSLAAGSCTSSRLGKARQLVISISPDWNSLRAKAQRFERTQRGNWKPVEPRPFDAVVGRNGMGWGVGLHPAETGKEASIEKRKRDGRSPAGVFRFVESFGYEGPETLQFNASKPLGFHKVDEFSRCIEDPNSKFYNHVIYDERTVQKDWSDDVERLRFPNQEYPNLYKYAVVVDHNRTNQAAAPTNRDKPLGSCIFIHLWKTREVGTAGCTGFEESHVKELVEWLDSRAEPVLVQLPWAVYLEKQKAWCLPKLNAADWKSHD